MLSVETLIRSAFTDSNFPCGFEITGSALIFQINVIWPSPSCLTLHFFPLISPKVNSPKNAPDRVYLIKRTSCTIVFARAWITSMVLRRLAASLLSLPNSLQNVFQTMQSRAGIVEQKCMHTPLHLVKIYVSTYILEFNFVLVNQIFSNT